MPAEERPSFRDTLALAPWVTVLPGFAQQSAAVTHPAVALFSTVPDGSHPVPSRRGREAGASGLPRRDGCLGLRLPGTSCGCAPHSPGSTQAASPTEAAPAATAQPVPRRACRGLSSGRRGACATGFQAGVLRA